MNKRLNIENEINDVLKKHPDTELLSINSYDDNSLYMKVKIENCTFILDSDGISDLDIKKPLSLKNLNTIAYIVLDIHKFLVDEV